MVCDYSVFVMPNWARAAGDGHQSQLYTALKFWARRVAPSDGGLVDHQHFHLIH